MIFGAKQQTKSDVVEVGENSEVPAQLNGRLREGDNAALAEVFEIFRSRLRLIIEFRLDERLRSKVDPDDILQEVFLAANQRLVHYADSSYTSPFLWLRAVLTQTMIDLHRRYIGAQKRNPDREISIDASLFPQATSTSLAIQLVGNDTLPWEAAARSDMMELMEKAIAGMELMDQEILALRHFEELSNGEAAQVLGIQSKAASIRYIRAMKRLRVILAEMTAYFRQSGSEFSKERQQ